MVVLRISKIPTTNSSDRLELVKKRPAETEILPLGRIPYRKETGQVTNRDGKISDIYINIENIGYFLFLLDIFDIYDIFKEECFISKMNFFPVMIQSIVLFNVLKQNNSLDAFSLPIRFRCSSWIHP